MLIEGHYDEGFGVVRIDGKRLDPRRSQRVWNHSPDGFAWGYAGSGPAQLALAILLAAGVPQQRAVELHQRFKREFLEGLAPDASFTLTVDIVAWTVTPDRLEV